MCRAVCSLALLWVLSGCSGAEVEPGAEDLGFGGADEFSDRDLGRHDAEAPDEDQGPRPDHGAPGCMITSPIDEPDPQGIDQNCDGIDGDRALAVFVAPGGDDRAAGDQEHPVATVARAFEIAADRRANQVLLAAGDWQVEQTIALADGIGLYGGYAPADGWRRSGEASVLRGPALAMVARGLTRPTTLARLTVRADDNSAPGGASVALLAVETVELLLTDGARLEAGVGGDGPSGRDGSAGSGGGSGGDGSPGAPDNQNNEGPGGAGGVSAKCAAAGGRGGDGGQNSDFAGQSGAAGEGGAAGGAGGTHDGCSPANGRPGVDGAAGQAGTNGNGGASAGMFELDGMSLRYRPANGADGGPGLPGGGGGGGGGSSGQGGLTCIDGAGNGGGGGGSGGCGGTAGTGGGGGGASVALVTVSATVALRGVTLATEGGGAGGGGGRGGDGGRGGVGGQGAAASPEQIGTAGRGGQGGIGGVGGAGGGGGGGPSVGLWVIGDEPMLTDVRFDLGPPGLGGSSTRAPGEAGTRQETLHGEQ